MKPIQFACRAEIALSPDAIVAQILDLANWPKFQGYGPLPGIKTAEFEVRTPNLVGSRIRVTNSDGSCHTEEIVEWQPERRLRLRFHSFSAPASCLAREFFETWEFKRAGHETQVTRSFEMHAKSKMTWPILWALSFFLRRAIARHLSQISVKS